MARNATIALLVCAAGLFLAPTPGSSAAHHFFTSLRIAKPTPVIAGGAVPGANASRSLAVMIGSMVADSVGTVRDEPDQAAADAATASTLAGFAAVAPAARTDRPTLTVIGAHEIRAVVKRAQLRTTLTQAGLGRVQFPASLDGTTVTFSTSRAIREQFGRCPEPLANTIQAQLQGPPPPSTDYGDCVILTMTPVTIGDVPGGLDVGQLTNIALELSGMSPQQAQSFQARFDWHIALSLSLPRGMRSYDTLDVAGARGMLINTANRRGPTYTLLWTKNGTAYALTGYGSSADALPLATSVR